MREWWVLTWECNSTRGRYDIGDRAAYSGTGRLCVARRTEINEAEAEGGESCHEREGQCWNVVAGKSRRDKGMGELVLI